MKAFFLVRSIGDLNASVNVVSVRTNVQATSRQDEHDAIVRESRHGTHQPVPRKKGCGRAWMTVPDSNLLVHSPGMSGGLSGPYSYNLMMILIRHQLSITKIRH
jgi:hypothetical protein